MRKMIAKGFWYYRWYIGNFISWYLSVLYMKIRLIHIWITVISNLVHNPVKSRTRIFWYNFCACSIHRQRSANSSGSKGCYAPALTSCTCSLSISKSYLPWMMVILEFHYIYNDWWVDGMDGNMKRSLLPFNEISEGNIWRENSFLTVIAFLKLIVCKAYITGI